MTPLNRRTLSVAAACLTLISASACGADEENAASADSMTVENCGIDVTVEAPPERVYAAYQPAIEIAHALGISDRLIETAFLDAQVLPEYADAQEQVPYVEKLPSREALLATGPTSSCRGTTTCSPRTRRRRELRHAGESDPARHTELDPQPAVPQRGRTVGRGDRPRHRERRDDL